MEKECSARLKVHMGRVGGRANPSANTFIEHTCIDIFVNM